MNINWYPGHMAKTKREIGENLKLIDIVLELLDARTPLATRNPDIDSIIKDKPRIVLLNKSDLADEKENKKWIEYFKQKGVTAICTDSNSGKGTKEVLNKVLKELEPKLEQYRKKGINNKTVKVAILGIPNVGKSSYINRIANKSSQKVSDRPGVTRQKQWIKVAKNIDLLDTPGVLWPKFESEEVALNLAYTGTIKDELIDVAEVSKELLKRLYELGYNMNIIQRYKLDEKIVYENQEELLTAIGKKRGALISGGEVDLYKAGGIVLDDFRKGKLGRITLEKIEE